MRGLEIFDVGSGPYPIIDAIHIDIKKERPLLDVVFDAQFLPFQNDSFSIAYASHVLEHVSNPILAIAEFKRVAQRCIIIRTPNAQRASASEDKTHIYSWNQNTLKQLLERSFCTVQINVATGRGKSKLETMKLLALTIFFRHQELIAKCWKRKEVT